MTTAHKQAFIAYLADYIEEQLTRDDMTYHEMISSGIEAFEGGAHGLAIDLELHVAPVAEKE